jgi:hypothetical protein
MQQSYSMDSLAPPYYYKETSSNWSKSRVFSTSGQF